jgi:hypothetical protein
LFGSKKLSIARVVHDGFYALLKSEHVAAHLLHTQSIREANIAGIVDEKIVDEITNPIEDESSECLVRSVGAR